MPNYNKPINDNVISLHLCMYILNAVDVSNKAFVISPRFYFLVGVRSSGQLSPPPSLSDIRTTASTLILLSWSAASQLYSATVVFRCQIFSDISKWYCRHCFPKLLKEPRLRLSLMKKYYYVPLSVDTVFKLEPSIVLRCGR